MKEEEKMNHKVSKQILSILLAVVMLVGLMPITVFAVESATVTTYNELLMVLQV